MASTLRTMGLFALMIILFTIVGWIVGGAAIQSPVAGMGFFLLIAIVLNAVSYFWSDKIILRVYRAKIVEPSEAPRLHRIVDHLATKADIPKPRVAIIPSHTPNAFATGRNAQHAVVAATTGILGLLDDDELEGVMAHELGHVKNRDILVMSAAATIAGAIAFAARSAMWGAMFGGRNRENLIGLLLVAVTAPIAAMLVQFAISRSREYTADRAGAEISGKPWALASALQKLEAGVARNPMRGGNPAQSHLFIVNPFKGNLAGLFTTHPPTEERVARLKSIGHEMGYMM